MTWVGLDTTEGAVSFCHWVMAQMRETFLLDGEYPSPDGFVLATCDVPCETPKPGQMITPGPKLPYPIPVRVPMRGGTVALGMMAELKGVDERDVFAAAVDILSRGTAAVGVVVMMEMWYLKSEGVTPPEGRWFEGQVKDHPDRREGLFVSLEHKVAGTRHWFADIHRNPTRVDAFVEKTFERSEGRLTHLAAGVGS
jgi:hypothetical protein